MKRLKVFAEQHNNIPFVGSLTNDFPHKAAQSPEQKKIAVDTLKAIAEQLVQKVNQDEPTEAVKTAEPVEPLLQENDNCYVIFPINHDDMWHMYKALVDNFWSVTENIQQLDMLVLDYDEKIFFKEFSSIFASPKSAGLVNENFAEAFSKIINVTEAKFFYGHQLFVQNIHYEMYNKLLEKFAQSADEREKLFKIVESLDAVIKKRKWVLMSQNMSFADQLLASACMHGLFFSTIDLVQTWFQSCPKKSNNHELIDIFNRMMIDQDLQRDFSCLMISHLNVKPSKERITEMINNAAKIECDFLLNGVKVGALNYTSDDVIQLIDQKMKALKAKLLNSFEQTKKSIVNNETETREESKISKENHYKITFDDDF